MRGWGLGGRFCLLYVQAKLVANALPGLEGNNWTH